MFHPETSSDIVVIGATATTTLGYQFEVVGDSLFDNLLASGFGQFNNVSTTDTLYVGGTASSTGGLFTQGNLHIGGTSTFDGNVGIGTSTPANNSLYVRRSARGNNRVVCC